MTELVYGQLDGMNAIKGEVIGTRNSRFVSKRLKTSVELPTVIEEPVPSIVRTNSHNMLTQHPVNIGDDSEPTIERSEPIPVQNAPNHTNV